MERRFLSVGSDPLLACAGPRRESRLILSLVLLFGMTLCCWFGVVHAQSLPLIKPSLPSAQTVTLRGNSAASGNKPQIPYQEELRQIHTLKQSYDSLKTQLKKLNELAKDTSLTDSTVFRAKSFSQAILDKEKQTLENMIAKDDIADPALKEAIGNTINSVKHTGKSLGNANDIADLESLMDTSEENLKALTNEWVIPKIEQYLAGTLDQDWEPLSGKTPDYFGTEGLPLLEMKGNSAEDIMALAKEHATGKRRHISDEYLRQADPDFRKLKIDSLGEIKVTKVHEYKQKSAFFEPNTLTGKNWSERTGLFLWYDPLTPFAEGVYISSGVSFGFSQQVRVYAGGAIRGHFNSSSWPKRQGEGITLGIRMSKNNWAFQANLTGSEARLTYPTRRDLLNYQGKILSSMVAVGRTVSMGPKIQSVVLVGGDPLYKKERSLSGSAIQISIGFEFENFLKPKKGKKG